MVEICLCVYKRVDRLPELLKQLKEQTYQDFKVNIWNNSRNEIDCSNLGKKRVRIYGGNGNIGSQARFRIIPNTLGNPIIFLDDDLSLEKDFVEYYYKKYQEHGKNCILGWFSKIFKTNGEYEELEFLLPEGREADYIGTGGMILDREIFDKELTLQDIPERYSKAEDLYLSMIARVKYDMRLYSIKPKCSIIRDRFDQHVNLRDYKKEAFLFMRKGGYWKLLNDVL